MLSTFFLLLLIAFQLWYLASGQVKVEPRGYQVYLINNPRLARLAGGVLLALTALLFGWQLGWMTGLSAWLVGLMGMSSLLVALSPFRYLKPASTLLLYLVFLLLELAL